MKRICCCLLCPVLLLMLLCPAALAASETPAWGCVRDSSAFLCLPGASGSEFTCQIGSVNAEVKSATPLISLEKPVETVILVDNSLSIAKDQRPRITELLGDLFANRLPGEAYTVATLTDQVNYLCSETSDYATLKSVVDSLEFQKQDTQLMDGLYNVLEALKGREDGTLRRLLVIADGMDDKAVGYTLTELTALVQELGYPIYTVGCATTTENATNPLQNLFSIARITPGSAYFYLPEVEKTMDIVSSVTSWNNSVQLEVPLPAEVCDGLPKALRVTSGEGGSVYTAQLNMPLAGVAEPTAEATPAPTPPPATPEPTPEPEPKTSPLPWIILAVVLVLLLAAGITLAILLVRRHKRKTRIEPSPDAVPPPRAPEATELFSGDDGQTAGIWDDASKVRLALQNVDVPSQRIEVVLNGQLIVGRDGSSCQVVLTEPSVARKQCRIFQQGGWVMLENLSHTNLTKLDGASVTEECELPNGSTLQMGRLRMRVEFLE